MVVGRASIVLGYIYVVGGVIHRSWHLRRRGARSYWFGGDPAGSTPFPWWLRQPKFSLCVYRRTKMVSTFSSLKRYAVVPHFIRGCYSSYTYALVPPLLPFQSDQIDWPLIETDWKSAWKRQDYAWLDLAWLHLVNGWGVDARSNSHFKQKKLQARMFALTRRTRCNERRLDWEGLKFCGEGVLETRENGRRSPDKWLRCGRSK